MASTGPRVVTLAELLNARKENADPNADPSSQSIPAKLSSEELWKVHGTYQNHADGERELQHEIKKLAGPRGWTLKQRKGKGFMSYEQYNCKDHHLLNCPACIRVEYTPTHIVLKKSRDWHQHNPEDDSRSIPQNIRDQMDECLMFGGAKPMDILNLIVAKGLKPVPDKEKLQSYVKRHKKALREQGLKGTYAALTVYCKDNQLSKDGDPNQPAVIYSYINEDGSGKIVLVVTTRHLLENVLRSYKAPFGSYLAFDGTYKLTWNGMPLVISGTVDTQQSFHPVIMSLVSNETEALYEEVMRALTTAIKEFFDVDYAPRFFMSDMAASIRNAAKNVWPAATILSCYFHMKVQGLRPGGGLYKKLQAGKQNLELVKQVIHLLANVT